MLPALFLAATITIAPTDDYKKIEAAQPGDEVVIAPGTYKFLVYLTHSNVHIHAQDPKNPPAWDLNGTPLDGAPGSYTAGDRGRGCWQLSGATGVEIDSIVFENCRNASANASGIRYYNGSNVTIRDCLFKDNDNGLTGGSQSSTALVEFSEFDANGNASAGAPTHNIYIYGGTYTMRYSYLHDPVQAQNFHVRATQALIESSWIAHGASYEGDLMTSDDFTGAGPYVQNMIFRGNVVVEGNPQNHGQIIAVYNDTGAQNLTMNVQVINNTVVAAAPQGALVHLSNADGTKMSAVMTNNVLVTSTTAYKIEDTNNGTVTGSNNWLQTGTNAGALTASIFGSDPMFDTTLAYRPTQTGPLFNGADPSVQNAPVTEYYLDDKTTRMYRVRQDVFDVGAFEWGTAGPGIGPYDPQPDLDGGACCFDDAAPPRKDSGPARDDASVGDNESGGGSGCGCDVVGISPGYGGVAALIGLLAAGRRRIRRAS